MENTCFDKISIVLIKFCEIIYESYVLEVMFFCYHILIIKVRNITTNTWSNGSWI